ncbi:succinate CoA transferase [Acidaminococcus sp. AM05-11]|uniref:succinate CoA transferase n=1 Tax=Acidaminococcus sp. AM05-11 TaxID=2291997 RepID=UPI000E49ECB3|nr:succinate CoA transferase [Acidaminococcus sp. AM05-11]RHK02859.1 succinate CoA transferase [Acidaminococcus sp. AM05-11]
MININDRVHCAAALSKITTAEKAAEIIQDGMNLGMSGFTPSGYPKALPLALAERGKKEPFKVNVWTVLAGPEIDTEMVNAGIVGNRMPYQTDKTCRNAINNGQIKYVDAHISHFNQLARFGFLPERRDVDVAIIEACAIKDLGKGKIGIIPTTSLGGSCGYVQSAKKVIIEVNVTQPVELEGMHDCYVPLDPPYRKIIPIEKPEDLIGTPYIPCDLDKVAAIVPCDIPDKPSKLSAVDDDARAMGQNLVDFFKAEVKAGRLPKNLLPLQSGVGSVANAVINGLVNSDFEDLTVFTEVIQDGMFDLIDAGKLRVASGASLTPSAPYMEKLYKNFDKYKKHLILRPQEISNNPEVVRRLGVIAMNTAIECDIYGNINSSHICGTNIMNGIGGSGDFARNGYLTVFFTNSMAKGGKISSVVPFCSHIDSTEHDVDIIVSERGVADLRGLSPKERTPIIIDKIANPKYQPLLKDYFERACVACHNSQTPHILEEAFSFHERLLKTGTMEVK